MDLTSICQIPLEFLRDTILEIEPLATPRKLRLLDCIQFTQHGILRICECSEFPTFRYSAISYVWRGITVSRHFPNPFINGNWSDRYEIPTDELGFFAVRGAEEADAISVDVLRHACITSLKMNAEYLWLDRLCVLQNNHDDKSWQIGHMYKVYKNCTLCIILPGGIRRLAFLKEETDWSNRAWTLQEVLAPVKSVVLFGWTYGSGAKLDRLGDDEGSIDEIVPGKSAIADVATIINASVVGSMSFKNPKFTFPAYPVVILGAATPNLTALGVAMSKIHSKDAGARSHAAWQSALMRTSSRPVDMIFSIMGLFGVTLDVRAFRKHERLRATIALAQGILHNGGTASWLGASVQLPPCKQLSTFPQFPQTEVTGKALVRVNKRRRAVAELMDGEFPNSAGLYGMRMPKGTMDDDGYLTFSRKATQVIVVPACDGSSGQSRDAGNPDAIPITAEDGTVLILSRESLPNDEESSPESVPAVFAILLAWFQEFYPGETRMSGIKLMIVKGHAPDRFHVTSYATLTSKFKDWVLGWPERQFTVGGPDIILKHP